MVIKKKSAAHEQKHVALSEKEFKVLARRNRLFGLWAAERLGLAGDAAAAYARDVVVSDMDEPGDADVLRKVLGDLAAKGVALSEAQVAGQLKALLPTARAQIAEEDK